MPPTMVTQASEFSRNIPVFPFPQQTGLVGILVQTEFRMPTRTRQAPGAVFQKTPGYCYFYYRNVTPFKEDFKLVFCLELRIIKETYLQAKLLLFCDGRL